MRGLPSPWIKSRCLPVALLVALAGSAKAAPNADLIGERPNAGGGADVIELRVGLLDIAAIEDREQRFIVDAYVEIGWQDPRLAVEDGSGSVRTFGVNDVWTPRLTIVNNRGLDLLLPEVVSVDGQGNAILRQRMVGPLTVDLKLREFPFDRQRLLVHVVSYQYSPAELVFSDDSEMIARVEGFSAGGWKFESLPLEQSVFRLAADGRGASQLTFGVLAERKARYYVLTVALPIVLILCLAWMVHWLPPDVVPARMGMSTATVFSVIAFGVSFRLALPKIDYLTRADWFFVYSTLLVLLSLVVTVMATRWVSTGCTDRAVRATRLMCRTFPLAFALIGALTFLG